MIQGSEPLQMNFGFPANGVTAFAGFCSGSGGERHDPAAGYARPNRNNILYIYIRILRLHFRYYLLCALDLYFSASHRWYNIGIALVVL